MKLHLLGLLAGLAGAALAGCGGKVVVDVGAGGGGTVTSGEGGVAEATVCGGKQGLPCPAGTYCAWNPTGSCGAFDNTGVCVAQPGGCTADCPGVCGCDGSFYCNACGAHAAGVDVSGSTACLMPPQPDKYTAWPLPTDAPRYLVTKTDFVNDRCVALVMVGFGAGAFPNVQATMGWSVESIGILPSAKECALGAALWPPASDLIGAQDAKGTVKQDNSNWPCFIDLDVSIAFPVGGPAWVPPSAQMTAQNLTLEGAVCPL